MASRKTRFLTTRDVDAALGRVVRNEAGGGCSKNPFLILWLAAALFDSHQRHVRRQPRPQASGVSTTVRAAVGAMLLHGGREDGPRPDLAGVVDSARRDAQ
jgi:hypothetical protein